MVDVEAIKKKYPRGWIVVQGFAIIGMATILSLILVSPIYLFEVDMDLLVLLFTFPVNFIPIPFNSIGLVLFPFGLLLIAWANYTLLHIGKIGLAAREPMQRPSNLIISGPYRFSRNPIYLGCLLALLGGVIVWSSLFVSVCTIAVYLIFRYLFIKREEIILEEEFGDAYIDYVMRVRRWF